MAVALLVLSVLTQILWMDPTVGPYDEGLVLTGAARVLRGDVPYRDFWTLYGPGSFYLLAGAFRVFGEQALVERVLDALTKGLIVALAFGLMDRFGRRAIAVAGALLVLALLVFLKNYGVPLFPALACGLFSMVALDEALAGGGHRGWAAAAGLAAGLTALFRHDLGVYVLALAAVGFLHARGVGRPDAARVPLAPRVLAFASGALAVMGPAVALLALAVPASDLYRDLLDIPLHVYPAVRALPFPDVVDVLRSPSAAGAGRLTVYLPLAVVAVCAFIEAAHRRARATDPDALEPRRTRLFHLLVLASVAFYFKGWIRVSPLHMGASLVLSIVLLAAGVTRASSRWWRVAMLTCGALAAGALLAKPFMQTARSPPTGDRATSGVLANRWMSLAPTLCRETASPALHCLRVEPDDGRVVRFLREHGAAGRRVYVGLGRHDKVYAGNTALYFAAGVVPATKWHDEHPGVQTTRAVQSAIVAELTDNPAAFVVLDTQWDNVHEPNASQASSGVTLLDDYLRSAYTPVYAAGTKTVLAPVPAAATTP